MDTLRQDLRFALRLLRKNPGFTSVALLSVALGIGADTSMYTLLIRLCFGRCHIAIPTGCS